MEAPALGHLLFLKDLLQNTEEKKTAYITRKLMIWIVLSSYLGFYCRAVVVRRP